MTPNLVRSSSVRCRACARPNDGLLVAPLGLFALIAFAFLLTFGKVQAAEASLLSHGDFEPDQATTVVEMPTTYVVGTQQTDIWYTRNGTGTQQVSYQDDGAGNHFVSVGTSPNQPGIFQVVAWPGEGTAQLSYAYSGPRAVVRIFGAETGDTIAKFSSSNSLTLIRQIDNPAATEWTNVTHEVELSGVYDYLVVRLGTASTGVSLYDNISMTAPVAPPDTAPEITTETLPGTQVGAAYSVALEATEGNGALAWSLASGSLPDGLILSAEGVISGVSTTAGTSTFTVRVADDDANVDPADEDTQELSIAVSVPVPPTVSITTTRTSGVAPLAISFDATATTSLTTERPFHDLHYRWDYGDPGSGEWATSRKSKNHDTGAVGGHVYETPGIYTATLTVTDNTGATTQQTVQITVEDPDVVFSGENTICISTGSDFTGAPAGAQQVTTTSWSDIANALGTGKRVLLKRGDTWIYNGVRRSLTFPGPGILGAFGTGPKPILTFDKDGTDQIFWMGTGSTPNQFGDFRFMDLDIRGRGYNWRFLHAEGACHNVTVLRVDMQEGSVFLNLAPSILSYYNNNDRPGHTMFSGFAIVETRFHHVIGDGGEFNARHIAYIGMVRSMFLGNVWNDSERGEHVLRVPFAQRLLIAHNELTNTRARKHLIKLHGGGLSDYNGQPVPPGENQTKFVTIADNYFTSALGDWLISVGPQNDTSAEYTRDIIIERNEVLFGGDSDTAFHVAAQEATVRNNVVMMPTASGAIVTFTRRGIEAPPLDNRAYNNSAFHSGTGSLVLVSVAASATNTTARNNFGKTLGTGTPVSGGGTNLQASNNVITATPGWVSPTPAAALQFDLLPDSEAIGAGVSVPVLDDFELSPRPAATAIALGAFESPPSTANAVPSIATTTIPDAQQGTSYLAVLEGADGNGRLTWTLDAGALPPGMTLLGNGQLRGTPTATGAYSFDVRVADSDGQVGAADEAVRTLSVTVSPPPNMVPSVTTTALPPAVTNTAYSRTLLAGEANGELTWTVDSGALPDGVSLSAAGVISGTPTVAGVYNFTVRVADSDALTGPDDEGTQALELTVNPAGSITAPAGSTFYNHPLPEQTGVFTVTFDVTASTKPISANVGLSNGPASAFSNLAAIMGFDQAGHFNARNGGAYSYTPPAVPFEAGVTYRFRFVVNIPAHTYSVFVTPEGGTEQLVASDFAFRTEQSAVASLSNLAVNAGSPVGSWISVTNIALGDPAGTPVTGVTVEPSTLALEVGESQSLTATVAPANASNTAVTWTTSDAGVATVSNTGVVTGVADGVATITATTDDGGFTATSEVTVTAAPSDDFVGIIFADAATHAYGSAGTLNTTDFRSGSASWQIGYTSDFGTSAFNPQGATTTMAALSGYAGKGYFEFWYKSTKAGTIRFQVRDSAAADAIVFNPDSAPILTPIVATTEWTRVEIPFDGWVIPPSSTANWRLMIRGWGGMTDATVLYDDIRFVGTGEPGVPVTGVTVEPATLALAVGESETLTATVAPANASNATVVWSTSDAGVATVSETGVVTAVAAGQATITATTDDGGFTASSDVTVSGGAANDVEANIFSDAGTHAYGSTGVLDTAVFRSGTASWRIGYTSDFANSAFNPQGAEITLAELTPYAGSGYFEFWYRSSQAGTIRFQVRDVGAGDAIIFNLDAAPILTPIVATDEWTRVEIPFNGWAAAPSATANWRLQIRAWGGMTGATVHYDDIRFVVPGASGEVPALGVSVSPTNWSMEVGQTQSLTATVAPPNATNQDVTWSSSNPAVATVNADGLVTAVGAGSATITVTTVDGGHTAEATISVIAPQAGLHPFLFFSADDIPAIRARMDAPEVADRRARLFARADALLNAAPSLESRVMEGNSGLLAFAYVVTGDTRYAQRAIEEALATAALDQWITGHDFNRGADLVSSERSLGTALVYDWCYDAMTPEQRATLRNALLEKGVAQYYLTVDPSLNPNWYTYDPVNNWRGVCHGGSGVASLVLYHESDLARRAADLANQHLPLALRSLVLEDSGGHEGITYNNYGVEFALKGVMAMQRFYGGHEALLQELAVERLGNYWSVYLFGPDHHFANFSRHNYVWGEGLYSAGTGIEGGPSSQRSTLIDSLVPGGDELMRWAADNGGQRFYWSGASPFYFLWRRIGAPSTFQQPKPELQDAVLFRGAGHGVFQSDKLWFAYSSGANWLRGDAGAFVLVAKNGDTWERLIHLEPSLNFFPSEHQSTYTINGVSQRTGVDTLTNRAQYLRFGSGDGFHYAASNIQPLYANTALTKLNRHVVMVRGKYVVMLDDLAGSEALTFDARFQTAQSNTISVNATGGTINGQSQNLHIVSAGFDPFTVSEGASAAVRHLRFSRQAEQAVLLTVLYPTDKTGAAPTVAVENGVVTISHGSETDEVAFVRDGQDWRLSAVNGASADGIPSGEERNIVAYRDGRDDTSEVPPWMLETVGMPTSTPVSGLTLATESIQLNVGQTQTLNANVTPAEASNRTVVWTSSDPAVASVTTTALTAASVRGVGVGVATITATTLDGGFTAQATVTVNTLGELVVPYAATAPALDGAIDAAYGSILGVINKPAPDQTVPPAANISATWRAAFTQTDLHLVVDVTDDAFITTEASDWNNDSVELFLDGNNSKSATSDNLNDLKFAFLPKPDGTVFVQTNVFPPNPSGPDYSGVQAAVTLKQGGASDYLGYVLEVKVPLAALGITPVEGWKLGIDLQINDNDTTGPRDRYVTWFGSNLNNNPAAYGTVTLGAIDGGGTDVPVTGVTVSPEEVTLEVGETSQLTATIEPAEADNPSVSWTTSDAAVATVDDAGLVTAVGTGEAVITVTTEDGGFTASSTVTVVLLPGSVPEIVTTALPAGEVGAAYSQQLSATGGDGELTWTVASGNLPNGLGLSPGGLISGTPLDAGTSSFVVRVVDADNYAGADDEDTQTLTLTIAPPPPVEATVTLGDLQQRYDGLPKTVSVTTEPGNLDVVVTYNGSSEPPVYPGVYEVVATIDEDGYFGSATAQLEIGITALVRHGLMLSGEIDGSMQVLLPESVTLNSGAWLSGDLLVPGRPGVTVNGNAAYVAVIEAGGSATPTQHKVTLNGNSVVRYVVRQVDPIALPTVAAPPAPSGTRNVSVNRAGQSIGDPQTIRNLTINSNGGEVVVPPGTYGDLTANGRTAFVLGVPGAEEPAVYNLQKLTLNSNARLEIVGPVILTVRHSVMFNNADAAEQDPAWLTLRVSHGGVTLNSGSTLSGTVVAPSGTVVLNGSSWIRGSVAADRLTINSQAGLRDPTSE